jgi:hypothetical protein
MSLLDRWTVYALERPILNVRGHVFSFNLRLKLKSMNEFHKPKRSVPSIDN